MLAHPFLPRYAAVRHNDLPTPHILPHDAAIEEYVATTAEQVFDNLFDSESLRTAMAATYVNPHDTAPLH